MSKVTFLTTTLIGLSVLSQTLVAEDTRILSILPAQAIFDFGDVNLSDSTTKTITLKNDGNGSLNISNIRLHENIVDSYSITNWSGALLPNATVDINITFIPNQLGLKQGLFYIDSDKTDTKDRSRLLRGTGVQDPSLVETRLLRVCEDGAISCLEDEAREEFNSVQIGTSKTQTVTIYNDGNSPMTVTNVRLHEKIVDMYTIDTPWTGIIPAGGHHDFQVTYTPNDEGVQSGRIYFETDKTDGWNRKELVGTGVSVETPCAGSISIEGMGDYGLVPDGNQKSMEFKISNLGTNPLDITNIYAHPSIADAFTVEGNWTNVTVPARTGDTISSTNVTLTYNSVTASDTVEQSLFYVVSSSCKGSNDKVIRAEKDATPVRILNFSGIQDFGTSDVGTPVTRTLTIQNEGNDDLVISSIYVHENIASEFTVDGVSLPVTIPANGSYDFTVTYNPNDMGVVSEGLIYVRGNNTNMTDGTMVLRGTSNTDTVTPTKTGY